MTWFGETMPIGYSIVTRHANRSLLWYHPFSWRL